MALVVGDLKHGACRPRSGDTPVEAGAPAGVAGGVMAGDLDLQPDGILIAVGAHFVDRLQIARGLALLPEAFARAAVIMGNAGLDASATGPPHSYARPSAARRRGIGDDGRHEAVGIEARREIAPFLKLGLVGGAVQ